MMKLTIDTSNTEKIILKLGAKVFETDARKEKSQRILTFLTEILKKEKVALTDITEIEVATGPGSFTGLRVGLSVAHALGWLLKIPVNGKYPHKGEFVEIKY